VNGEFKVKGVVIGSALALIMSAVLSPMALEASTNAPREADSEIVVLLHGHSRTNRSMNKIATALLESGYAVENIDYPSREMNIDGLVEHLHEKLEKCCRNSGRKVHFVTHSLGGILVRYYLEKKGMDNLGRVVMLSPPNSGSEVVDLLKDLPLVRDYTSESRLQLGTEEGGFPGKLEPVDFELGIIAGDRSLFPLFSWIIPGPDDGIVSVRSSRTEGMTDFLVVPHSHTFIMNSPEVIRQAEYFLREGRFDR
jgi:triacylglycerol lipase